MLRTVSSFFWSIPAFWQVFGMTGLCQTGAAFSDAAVRHLIRGRLPEAWEKCPWREEARREAEGCLCSPQPWGLLAMD